MDEKIKQITEKLGVLETSLKEARESSSAKDETIKRLETDLRIVREVGALAGKDPVIADKLLVALNALNEKQFKFPESIPVSGTDKIVISEPVKISEKDLNVLVDKLDAILNKKEAPLTEIKVSNLGEIKGEKEVKVSNLEVLGKLFTTGLTELKNAVSAFGSKAFNAVVTGEVKITNKEIEDAIPVRLASRDLKYFYDAMTTVLGSGGDTVDVGLLQQIITAIEELGGSWYDNIAVTYPDTDEEVYTYKLGLVTVQTITVVYTDATKVDLLSVTKT